MKKVYILNDKPTYFQKMLAIFKSEETAKRYEAVVNPLKDVAIDNVEYVFEKYPEYLFFGYWIEWDKFE